MEQVLNIRPLSNYCIEIQTQSVNGIFDVKPYLNGNAFKMLKNKGYFSTVYATKYGIEWINGQDFSSDTIIYDINNQ
ncbi:MAG: DUF2442 domain-containing protein [Gammaproteobacteria bacterium]|nr:DUF2442 domain-containing protein [Gammaproteobacteria bacterium]